MLPTNNLYDYMLFFRVSEYHVQITCSSRWTGICLYCACSAELDASVYQFGIPRIGGYMGWKCCYAWRALVHAPNTSQTTRVL